MFKGGDYICSIPFTDLEIMEDRNHLCCATWLPTSLPKKNSLIESWNSIEANNIRESVLNGSYTYCKENICPFIMHIKDEGIKASDRLLSPIYPKNALPSELKEKINNYKKGTLLPSTVHFTFDATCNLKCPSCRVDIMTSSSAQMRQIEATIDNIEKDLATSITTIYITGSGDPFASPSFRKFLRNFQPSRYPKLRNIHLHTNATRWTAKMWDSMKNIHPYVKTCEISIDAATKSTYETKTRLGGDWDKLIANLHFISSIKTLKLIKTSFVVQKSNYREMENFYNLMISIFGRKVNIFYSKILDWGALNSEQFQEAKVWDKSHNEYPEFILELNKVLRRNQVTSNLQDLLKPNSVLI